MTESSDRLSTEIITYHGWGFSSAIWKHWTAILPAGTSVSHADQGYFGERIQPEFRQLSSRKVILTHSFGLHLCPEQNLKEADHLVIMSGFLSFHPEKSADNRRSRLVLQQMMSRFVEKPKEVLSGFYKNTFSPVNGIIKVADTFSHDRLLEDLGKLETSRLTPEYLYQVPEITIIHGEADKIVPKDKSRRMFAVLRRRSQYFEIKHAGHGVPFTHSEQCCKFLLPALFHEVSEESGKGG